MPDINLDKDRYRVQTRNGNWIVRDKPWMLLLGCVVGLFFVGFAWWNRAEITTASMFGLCALMAFAVGVLFANFIRRFD